MHAVLCHDTPYANALLLEKNLTRFIWFSTEHLKEALAEILHLAQHDFEAAVLKASCLYGMARAEYKSHFLTKFDPKVNHQPTTDSVGLHLPRCCNSIYAVLQHLGVVPAESSENLNCGGTIDSPAVAADCSIL